VVYKYLHVPVAVGCVVARPEKPPTLLERYTDEQWAALAPGAIASAVLAPPR